MMVYSEILCSVVRKYHHHQVKADENSSPPPRDATCNYSLLCSLIHVDRRWQNAPPPPPPLFFSSVWTCLNIWPGCLLQWMCWLTCRWYPDNHIVFSTVSFFVPLPLFFKNHLPFLLSKPSCRLIRPRVLSQPSFPLWNSNTQRKTSITNSLLVKNKELSASENTPFEVTGISYENIDYDDDDDGSCDKISIPAKTTDESK